MSTLKQRMKEISPDRRKKIGSRAAELAGEEMTLQELRQARKLTQVRMAKSLRITQDGVSRMEGGRTSFSRPCERPSKLWAAACFLSLNFPTANP